MITLPCRRQTVLCLNLEHAGVTREDIPARVVWFKDRVLPKAVLDVLEG